MSATRAESVDDHHDHLDQHDHMRGMERIQMVVETITQPFPSVSRVTARIAPSDPAAWTRPNVAFRLEVDNPPGERPVSRIYTVRSFDARRSLIEIDFVMHPDDSPAMRWLGGARPGTVAHLVGPRPHLLPDYAAGKRVAIFADETAIPAVHAILRHWEAGTPGILHVETADRAAFEELPQIADVERRLLLRDPGTAAGTSSRLMEAARALPACEGWSVWAAGERQAIRMIRQHFMEHHGMAKEDVRAFGYWRKGVSSSQIDRARLDHYVELCAKGHGLARFEDIELAEKG